MEMELGSKVNRLCIGVFWGNIPILSSATTCVLTVFVVNAGNFGHSLELL